MPTGFQFISQIYEMPLIKEISNALGQKKLFIIGPCAKTVSLIRCKENHKPAIHNLYFSYHVPQFYSIAF